jgi:hypothetical protein
MGPVKSTRLAFIQNLLKRIRNIVLIYLGEKRKQMTVIMMKDTQ